MVQTQRKPQKRKTSRQPVRRRRTSRTRHGFFGRYPRWAWWIGGIAVVLLYVGAFYYFFVGPTGFRWRALYGDAEYPLTDTKYEASTSRIIKALLTGNNSRML